MKPVGIMHVVDKFGVAGSSISGVTKLFSWWMPRFNTEKYRVQLVGLRAYDDSARELENTGISLRCLERGKFDPGTMLDLMRIIREDNISLIHVHGYGASNFGRAIMRRSDVRCVVHEHFVDPAMPKYQQFSDRLLRSRIDAGIAVSESVREFMIEERCMPSDKIRVIYNGAPLAHFSPSGGEESMLARQSLGIAADEVVIGTIGRLDQQKGLKYLLQAMPEVLAHDPKVKLIIVGDGPLNAELQSLAADLQISERVIFPGFIADIRAIQSIFDIQAFPSLWEGTPLTVFEAMAMSRPIVSTNVDGLGEVLEHGVNAWVVKPRDVDGLLTGIKRLLDDKELRAQLATNAREASRSYDIGETVRQIEQVYEGVLAQ
jgi:glycosyltransferase involved in cell wall biosynthesis